MMGLVDKEIFVKSQLITVDDHGIRYMALQFICPGCALHGGSGLHSLPVNSPNHPPSWDWNGDQEKPSLSPSILTRTGEGQVCHSFLRDGVFEYLSDCTHHLAAAKIEMPDLPDWVLKDRNR